MSRQCFTDICRVLCSDRVMKCRDSLFLPSAPNMSQQGFDCYDISSADNGEICHDIHNFMP